MMYRKILFLVAVFSAYGLHGAGAASASACQEVAVSRDAAHRNALLRVFKNAAICDQLVVKASTQAVAAFTKSRPTDGDLALVLLCVSDAAARSAIVGFNARDTDCADCDSAEAVDEVVPGDGARDVVAVLQSIQEKSQNMRRNRVFDIKPTDANFVMHVKDSALLSFDIIAATMMAAQQDIVRLQEASAHHPRSMPESTIRDGEQQF